VVSILGDNSVTGALEPGLELLKRSTGGESVDVAAVTLDLSFLEHSSEFGVNDGSESVFT